MYQCEDESSALGKFKPVRSDVDGTGSGDSVQWHIVAVFQPGEKYIDDTGGTQAKHSHIGAGGVETGTKEYGNGRGVRSKARNTQPSKSDPGTGNWRPNSNRSRCCRSYRLPNGMILG